MTKLNKPEVTEVTEVTEVSPAEVFSAQYAELANNSGLPLEDALYIAVETTPEHLRSGGLFRRAWMNEEHTEASVYVAGFRGIVGRRSDGQYVSSEFRYPLTFANGTFIMSKSAMNKRKDGSITGAEDFDTGFRNFITRVNSTIRAQITYRDSSATASDISRPKRTGALDEITRLEAQKRSQSERIAKQEAIIAKLAELAGIDLAELEALA